MEVAKPMASPSAFSYFFKQAKSPFHSPLEQAFLLQQSTVSHDFLLQLTMCKFQI